MTRQRAVRMRRSSSAPNVSRVTKSTFLILATLDVRWLSIDVDAPA